MPPPMTASEVRDNIATEARKQGIDRRTVELVLQAIHQAGLEIRDKSGRDPMPLGDEVPRWAMVQLEHVSVMAHNS